MSKHWNLTLGSFLGGFKVNGSNTARLARPSQLSVSELPDGGESIRISARYDPPGSGWIAFAAAIITAVFVVVLAQVLGFMAGPGWLVWYFIIVAIRRRDLSLDFASAESIVLDRENSRMAIRTNVNGRIQWVAFEIKERYHEALEAVTSVLSPKSVEGHIARPNIVVPVTILLILIIGAFAAIATTIVSAR